MFILGFGLSLVAERHENRSHDLNGSFSNTTCVCLMRNRNRRRQNRLQSSKPQGNFLRTFSAARPYSRLSTH